MATNIQGLLTNKEMAELLNVNVKTLSRYRKDGLPFLQLSDRIIRYDEEKVMEWIRKRSEEKGKA